MIDLPLQDSGDCKPNKYTIVAPVSQATNILFNAPLFETPLPYTIYGI